VSREPSGGHAGTPAGATCVVGDAWGAHKAGRFVTLNGLAVSADSTARRGLRRPSGGALVEPFSATVGAMAGAMAGALAGLWAGAWRWYMTKYQKEYSCVC
jgi:hypothetical protein